MTKRAYCMRALRYWVEMLLAGDDPRSAGPEWREAFDRALSAGFIERSGEID